MPLVAFRFGLPTCPKARQDLHPGLLDAIDIARSRIASRTLCSTRGSISKTSLCTLSVKPTGQAACTTAATCPCSTGRLAARALRHS